VSEIAHLSGHRDWIDMDFVERERTPEPAVALGIQMYLIKYNFQIQSLYFTILASNALEGWFTTGYKKPIYSRPAA
jgi:hypothetical protein